MENDKRTQSIGDESDIFKLTKGFIQTNRQFEDFIKLTNIQNDILIIQKKHKDKLLLKEPENKWLFFLNEHYTDKNGQHIEKDQAIRSEAIALCGKYNISSDDYSEILRYYIHFNKIVYPDWVNHWGSCVVKDEYDKHCEPEYNLALDKEDDFRYPLSIRISPNASKREILDFVEKTFLTRIKPLQDIYRKEPPKFKTRNRPAGERNLFIIKNYKSMPKDLLLKEVRRRFNLKERDINKTDLAQIYYSESKKKLRQQM